MEILLALKFYLVFLTFSFVAYPLTSRIFEDKFYSWIFSRLAGFLLSGSLVWLLASLRLLNFQNSLVITSAWFIFFSVGIFFAWKQKFFSDKAFLQKICKYELVSILIYLAYLYLRSMNSALNDTERFMDLAFLQSAGKSEYFPFIDPWYAGKTVNYYYYGSYLMAFLSNLARVPYLLSYNLSLGLIFSQSFLLVWGLLRLFGKKSWVGILGALLVTTLGSLFYAGCVVKSAVTIPITSCSYVNSTRLFSPSYIINEIPSYSFTVGDLHAHLLAMPLFLFTLVLFYLYYKSPKVHWTLWLLVVVSLSSAGMTNVWDLVTLSCLYLLVLLAKLFQVSNWRLKGFPWLVFLYSLAIPTLGILVLTRPYFANFTSPVLGLGFIPSYVKLYSLNNVQWPTPLLGWFGLWGGLLSAILLTVYAKRKKLPDYAWFLALLVLVLGILFGVELFFVKDIYSVANPSYFRANTTFKFGYHAWVLLSLVFASLVLPLEREKRNGKYSPITRTVLVLTLVIFFGGLFYPYQAIRQFYLSNKQPLTLNGADWLKTSLPEDYKAISYINSHISGRPVIAEAVGDSYSRYSRISTYTGTITPMGWTTHEWTWRLDSKSAKLARPGVETETGWSKIAAVSQGIQALYETTDLSTASSLLDKYSIQYVYIGGLEKEKYPLLSESKFSILGKPIWQQGSSSLYQIFEK